MLREDGTLGLVWNLWDDESPLAAALSALLPPFGDAGEPTEPVIRSPLFGGLEEETFHWVRPFERDELVTGLSTQSSVATLEPEDRFRHLEAVGRFWDERSTEGMLEIPYRTHAYRAARI